jgi:TatA/E family protein of Tat protein translocase
MLSIPHMIIIFIVALVFFGPEKLPELARNIGKVMAEFKRATGDFKSTFEDHLRDLEREADQRRIMAPTATASPAASLPSATPAEAATDAEASSQAVPGVVPANAPWEQAADTAADAMNISAEPQEPSVTAPEPAHETAAESAPESPTVSPDPQETPHQHESKATPEPPVHDDLPA